MRVKLEEKTLDDGRVRQIVMYRKHWWSSWKPFLNDDGDLIVNYGLLGERERKKVLTVQDEYFDMLPFLVRKSKHV